MINDRRQYLYSNECPDGRIFEIGDEVPEGFVDTPAKLVKKAKETETEVEPVKQKRAYNRKIKP